MRNLQFSVSGKRPMLTILRYIGNGRVAKNDSLFCAPNNLCFSVFATTSECWYWYCVSIYSHMRDRLIESNLMETSLCCVGFNRTIMFHWNWMWMIIGYMYKMYSWLCIGFNSLWPRQMAAILQTISEHSFPSLKIPFSLFKCVKLFKGFKLTIC